MDTKSNFSIVSQQFVIQFNFSRSTIILHKKYVNFLVKDHMIHK